MKRKYVWMGIVAVTLALGISAVHARGHRGKHHHFAGPRFEALDLTQVQKDQLKSLRTESHKKMIQLRADMELARVEMRELLNQKNPNENAVKKAVAEVNAAQAKITETRVRQKLGMNKILTEEQLQKLEEMPKRRRGGRGHGRRGGHGGHGMGMHGESGSGPSTESNSRI